MPFGDSTGPAGMCPRTGRGFGYCSGYDHPGYVVGRGMGRGIGRGFGRGFGWRAGFGPGFAPYGFYDYSQPYSYTPEQEKEYLKNQVSAMERTIESLKKRMSEIEGKK